MTLVMRSLTIPFNTDTISYSGNIDLLHLFPTNGRKGSLQ